MIRSIAAAASLLFFCSPAWSMNYAFETGHTEGIIRWSHLGFSHPTAQFSQVEGTVDFDPADPTKAAVVATITLAHLSSGVPDLDDNLHSSNFFDVEKFPVATFRSTQVIKGASPNKLVVTGDLSLHGVTRSVILDVTINKIGTNIRTNLPSIGFDATTTLYRSEFGLGAFVPQVSDKVDIHLTAQADEADDDTDKPKGATAHS